MERTREIRISVKKKEDIVPSSWTVKATSYPGVKTLCARKRGELNESVYSYRFDPSKFTLSTARHFLSSKGIKELRETKLFHTMENLLEENGLLQKRH